LMTVRIGPTTNAMIMDRRTQRLENAISM
jgi:hypothetical protein